VQARWKQRPWSGVGADRSARFRRHVRSSRPGSTSDIATASTSPLPDGVPGSTEAASHDVVVIEECLLAAPRRGRAARRGEGSTRRRGSDVARRSEDRGGGDHRPGPRQPREAVITEIVAGVRFQVSGRAFFQPNTDGADTLVDAGRRGGGRAGGSVGGRLCRRRAVRRRPWEPVRVVVAIESSRTAVGDLRRNAPEAGCWPCRPCGGWAGWSMRRMWSSSTRPAPASDRRWSRRSCGRSRTIVSVSCDAATFARDARSRRRRVCTRLGPPRRPVPADSPHRDGVEVHPGLTAAAQRADELAVARCPPRPACGRAVPPAGGDGLGGTDGGTGAPRRHRVRWAVRPKGWGVPGGWRPCRIKQEGGGLCRPPPFVEDRTDEVLAAGFPADRWIRPAETQVSR
jgi:hypothetical protein